MGVIVVAQRIKLLLEMLATNIGILVQVPASPLLTCLERH